MNHPQIIKFGKTEYVILPKAEYLQLQGFAGIPEGSVDAIAFARTSMGASLRAAREQVGLTQADLAKAMRKSQSMVSGAESGTISVSERYVRAVLKACGLPMDWARTREKPTRHKRGGKR